MKYYWATIICPYCHKQFIINKTISKKRKFCSTKCQRKYYYIENREEILFKRKVHYYKNREENTRDCIRCGKSFKPNSTAKLCPDCLEWLAYHEENTQKRQQYIRNFNIRKDCQDREYIGHLEKDNIDISKYKLKQKAAKRERTNIVVFGEKYRTAKDMCEKFGVSYGRYKRKINSNKSPEEAIEALIDECGCSMIKYYVIRRLKHEA